MSRLDRLCLALTGQDSLVVYHQLQAIYYNILTYFLVLLRLREEREVLVAEKEAQDTAEAVLVLSPGGLERLSLQGLDKGVATVGYNVTEVKRVEGCNSLAYIDPLPPHCAVVRIASSSVNYADITIRWGLYESAIRFVGYPICPGFDFCGTVERAGPESGVAVGDKVMGITFFGAYSSRLLVPGRQLCQLPPGSKMSADEWAALPSVAGTALHALHLAKFWPQPPLTNNRAVLIHSAAGGVGSMLVQMAKKLGCSPVVAVVGASHKVEACSQLGADVVLDKSSLGTELWSAVKDAAPGGYAAVFDANGQATLAQSYAALAQTGTLVLYGFHTNLPTTTALSPLAWVRMVAGVVSMPKFEPMDLVLSSKAVAGFNLSFFAQETALVDAYMQQLIAWASAGDLVVARTTTFALAEAPRAHKLIQTGQTVGKLVLRPR